MGHADTQVMGYPDTQHVMEYPVTQQVMEYTDI